MPGGMSSVMGNECSSLVSVLTAVLHGVGVYSQHWSELYKLDNHGGRSRHGRDISHEGLWRTCTWNATSKSFQCVDVHYIAAWLLTVQILVAVSFGGALVASLIKLLYHFNPSCNSKALAQGFILLSLFVGFLLLLAVSIYAGNYEERHPNLTSSAHNHHKHQHHYHSQLSWGFTVEVVSVVLSIGTALLAMCEITPNRTNSGYTEI